MQIRRDIYLNRLIEKRHNGLVKIITGLRRCGKSYILFEIFKNWLIKNGVPQNRIIEVKLDDYANKGLRKPDAIYRHIKKKIKGQAKHYILLDEVQLLEDFAEVLNGLLHIPNADIYVTGSNAKFLSKDIATEFRGRGDEMRLTPLSFMEFMSVFNGSRQEGSVVEGDWCARAGGAAHRSCEGKVVEAGNHEGLSVCAGRLSDGGDSPRHKGAGETDGRSGRNGIR